MVGGYEGAGEQRHGVEVEFAGWKEDYGGADDEACDSKIVEEFPLVGGRGRCCARGRRGFCGRRD